MYEESPHRAFYDRNKSEEISFFGVVKVHALALELLTLSVQEFPLLLEC